MNIVVIGAGYVGLVTGACFAEFGNQVTCIDIDITKIDNLSRGVLPIYEPGLETLIHSNLNAKRLHFASTLSALDHTPQIIFIAVGTPSDTEGRADIHFVLQAAKDIGQYITEYCVVVDKSTVPVGMADEVNKVIMQELALRQLSVSFDMVSNPEFLREGAAIQDFMSPDRIIIGLASERAKLLMQELYLPITRNPERIYFMQVKDAEMTKYAANAMLATRISFMNEMALICERLGVDIENVRIGIGSDDRIGSAFLNAGCGYGGSCFPKDVKALINMSKQHGIDPLILNAVEQRNFLQKERLFEKITHIFGEDLTGITAGVWGLSFKPGTDDMREASSLVLIRKLIESGAKIQAYDPVAITSAKSVLPSEWLSSGKLVFAENQYAALNQADLLALITEWKPFCYPNITTMKQTMRRPYIFDGRNQYNPTLLRDAGFEYHGIGR